MEVIGTSKEFLNRTPAEQKLRENIDKWDFLKQKSICSKKKWSLNLRDHPESGRKYLPATRQRTDNQNM
jgi:hypothetical protein